jgi:beta-glucosidase
VQEGSVPIEVVDSAVRRILRLKLQLGLFDEPYTNPTLAEQTILRGDFREHALEVARKSMVLLKNQDSILPLSPGAQRLAVIGPLADERRALLGCWAGLGEPGDVQTVLEAIRDRCGEAELTYAPGCPLDGPPDIDAALAVAKNADVVIVVLGESADLSGEAHSRVHLGLPGRQQELLDALHGTGKPVIAVLMSGRPLVIPRMTEQVSALLQAWHGGIQAGRAVADLLFGVANPSGKLTAGFPRAEGQIPVYYAHKNTGRPVESAGTKQFDEPFKSRYLDEPNDPLFPFGYGLSYTTFDYRNLRVETPVLGQADTLVATVEVRNSGQRAGDEIVQLYVRDLVGSTTRPVKELKGFQRITLQPGEEQTVRFEVPVRELGHLGIDMHYRVEPGAFKLWIGPDSAQGLEGEFSVS